MRKAEVVLNIIRERGKRGLPLEDVYRQLYNPDLYLRAYGNIYRNDGAMTRGATTETVDGMSLAKIGRTIENVRTERHRWTPVRRTHIPKKNGKTRPLGIPTWTDKLLQEVIRSILEAYYEPQFSELSHGFRPERGCHTALTNARTWRATTWFVEGDIKGCFDNIDHQVLLSILREKIRDERFIRLIEGLLKAGYLEDWKYNKTLSGTPQGGIVSPILSNIYLDKLDRYVEKTLIPEYNRGQKRKPNYEYYRVGQRSQRCRRLGKTQEAKEHEKQFRNMPSWDTEDPDFRRLHYVRYADDFLLGFIGPKAEAEDIKKKLRTFLKDTLNLEMSDEKTLVTHARKGMAKFLGYHITCLMDDTRHNRQGERCVNGMMTLRMPAEVVEAQCARYVVNGKPERRTELIDDDDLTIIDHYQSRYRGIVQYYLLARNVYWLHKLHWTMQMSLLKTLAAKHKTSVSEIARKYRTKIDTPHGIRTCLEARIEREGKKPLIRRFGGIPLKHKSQAILVDQQPDYAPSHVELVARLLAEECEICGSTDRIEVHHIRKLADLQRKDGRERPRWMEVMSSRKRKTLVTCRRCHHAIHSGQPLPARQRNPEA
jgi:group II intron reverse transcriptase/maturase